ncbi:MAG TPA: hypothetical protein VIN57_01260 [Magnetovibrio sp.]
MNRKLQIDAPHPDHRNAQIAYRFLLDGAVALLIAALTLWLLMIPVNATERPQQQMTLMTQDLPVDFNTKSAALGLVVIDIEPLEMLQSQIVSIALPLDQLPTNAVETLTTAFPNAAFVLMEDSDDGFGWIEN